MSRDAALIRLRRALDGSGCQVDRPGLVWAHGSAITDAHVLSLEGWANLEYFVADETRLTDAVIPVLASFPLTTLSLGNTSVTASGFCGHDWPTSLESLGVYGIDFSGFELDALTLCHNLKAVCANGCNLSRRSIDLLASIETLSVLEAYGAMVDDDQSRSISSTYPAKTFRFNAGIFRDGQLINPHRN